MKQDDKLIRELLKQGFLKEAPEGFTASVMQNVSAIEHQKEASVYIYLIAIFAAIVAGLGVIYLINPELLMNYVDYFINFLYSLMLPFKNVFSSISVSSFTGQGSGLFLGILMIIALLLGFERFFLARKRAVNIFVW
jgi:hypothetical protein